jgi:hypothetical protein
MERVQSLLRECNTWSFLSHENVWAFKGLDEQDNYELPLLVTAFVQHRCMDYIRDHPESKLTVVRLLLKMQISSV